MVAKPPKDLTSFEGRKWLQQISFAASGEIDPIFSAWRDAYDNHGNWNTAYGWGNHASAGYLTSASIEETDPVFSAWDKSTGISITESQISDLQSYLTSETSHADVVVDGDFASQGLMKRGASSGTYSIVTDSSANWDTAYGWGDHADAGYLTAEIDPVFQAWLLTSPLSGYVPYIGATANVNLGVYDLTCDVVNAKTLSLVDSVTASKSNATSSLTVQDNNGSVNYAGLRTETLYYHLVGSTSTLAGVYGDSITVLRNSIPAGGIVDSGTIASLTGSTYIYGHYLADFAATPITTEVGGITLIPYNFSGTIGTLYGLRIFDVQGNAPTTHYPIYQEATAGTNYFASKILQPDNTKHIFGTGLDSSIYYDATNLIINPKEQGSGYLSVLGNIVTLDKIGAGAVPVLGKFEASYTGGYYGMVIRFSDATSYGCTTVFDDRNSGNYVFQYGVYGSSAGANTSNAFFYNTCGGGIGMYCGSGATVLNDLRLQATTTGAAFINYIAGINDTGNLYYKNAYGSGANLSWKAGGTITTGRIGHSLYDSSGAKADLIFSTYAGSLQERMRILGTGNVGIGTTSPDAKLDVLSTTEQLRLTYTDGSVYTAFTTNSSGNLTVMPSGGNMGVGVAATTGTALNVSKTFTLAGATGERFGIQNRPTFTANIDQTTGVQYGMSNGVYLTGDYDFYISYGMQGFLRHDGSASSNVGRGDGFNIQVGIGSNGGTITDLRGIAVSSFRSSGTITTLYGIKIENITHATTNYSIYTGTAQSYFGGNIIQPDNVKSIFGTGLDAETYYDGADWWFKPAIVGTGSMKVGDGTNSTNFDSTGHQTMAGTARPWRDELADAITLQQSGPGISRNVTEASVEYTTASNLSDYMYCNVQLNHDKDLTVSIYPHIHYWQAENNIPNFLLQYRWQTNLGAKTTSWTNLKCNTNATAYTSGTINNIATSAAITVPVGTQISDIVQFRILRDNANTSGAFTGADPYTATVGITAFDVHFMINSLGSTDEYSK